nr:hypothetical protein [Methylomarinum sp. Ch1-1]MDP4519962.1 hypothetical protein [Methylomarinum sp. Ch1-1]
MANQPVSDSSLGGAPPKSARRRPALGPNGSFRAEDGAPTQSTVLPSDMLNCVKRIKNRCASYRQHTLPHRRAASRSKPPKNATGAKLAIVRIPGGLPGGESTLRLRYNAWISLKGASTKDSNPVDALPLIHPTNGGE